MQSGGCHLSPLTDEVEIPQRASVHSQVGYMQHLQDLFFKMSVLYKFRKVYFYQTGFSEFEYVVS